MSDRGDGFTLVTSKGKQKKNKLRSTNNHKGTRNPTDQEDEVDTDEIVKKVVKLKGDILCDQYANIVKDGVNYIKKHCSEETEMRTAEIDLVSYGIGNFASCLIARYQLALLLIMRDEFADSVKHCEVYDPVFSEGEKESLQKLSFSLIQENEEGKRKVDCPTVFYMPHCGKPLYNNLLWANWAPTQLRNIVIIGNSFNQMLESIPSSIIKKEASFVFEIGKYTKEVPLENKFHFDDIFNNTSIHFFKKDSLKCAENSLWTHNDEPVYDDDNVEIILCR